MKDLFQGSSAIQQMKKLGPGNNCWTVSKVVDEIVTGWKGRKFSILTCTGIYASSCVYEMCAYTCYDSLPNAGNRKLPSW